MNMKLWRWLMTVLRLEHHSPRVPIPELRAETDRVEKAVRDATRRHVIAAQDLTKSSLDQVDRVHDVRTTVRSVVGRLNASLDAAEQAAALTRRNGRQR